MSQEVRLLPYTVESIETKLDDISYGVFQCQAPSLWAMGEKGAGVVVAVIDTGIENSHPFLKEAVLELKDFTSEGNNLELNGHGTHVAGIIKSVAPDVKLIGLKVLGQNGSGDYSDIIKAIQYAIDWKGPNNERVRVMNMSLGGPGPIPALEQAILQAVSRGILVVVASGNERRGDATPDHYESSYPALINECITVAACDENKKLAYFSNNHLQVDIIAAGVRVLSSYKNGTYAKLSGTSMATPHVSGMLALLIPAFEKQFKRTLTESELYAILVKCCCTLDYPKSAEGNGLPELGEAFKTCEE